MSIPQGKILSDLPLISQLLGNESVYIVDENGISARTESSSIVDLLTGGGPSGFLQASNNLSDLDDIALARANLDLKSMALQESNNVNISGGTIENTKIGSIIPEEAVFTTLTVIGGLNLPNNSIGNNILVNSEVTVNTTGAVTGGGSVSLGGSLTIDLSEIDGGGF